MRRWSGAMAVTLAGLAAWALATFAPVLGWWRPWMAALWWSGFVLAFGGVALAAIAMAQLRRLERQQPADVSIPALTGATAHLQGRLVEMFRWSMPVAGAGLLMWSLAPWLAATGDAGLWSLAEWTGLVLFLSGGIVAGWTWLRLRRLRRS